MFGFVNDYIGRRGSAWRIVKGCGYLGVERGFSGGKNFGSGERITDKGNHGMGEAMESVSELVGGEAEYSPLSTVVKVTLIEIVEANVR